MSDLKELAKNPDSLGKWPFLAILVELGLYAAHNGLVAKARNLFEGLIKATPNSVPVKLGLSFTYLVANEFDKAEVGIKEVLDAHPDHAEAQALLGLSVALSGNIEDAKPILAKAMKGTGPAAELAKFLMDGQ
ncbi:MAG: tetratricopeptide repeat protein [Deltaproteobacteria bacterium]|nr:tetratricopeptide repeat protein [Deltaproteobacteria bacterium]